MYCDLEPEDNQIEEETSETEKFLKKSYKEDIKKPEIVECTERLLLLLKLLQEIESSQSKISKESND